MTEKLKERARGRLYFGETPRDRWCIIDPTSDALHEAIDRLTYGREEPGDTAKLIAAAWAYHHLTTHPMGTERAVKKLRAIRRAVMEGGEEMSDDNEPWFRETWLELRHQQDAELERLWREAAAKRKPEVTP